MKQAHKDNISKAMKGKMPKFIPNNKGKVRKEELIKEFEEKWRQDKNTGFLKPLCHIDDIRELLQAQEQDILKKIEDMEGTRLSASQVEYISQFLK